MNGKGGRGEERRMGAEKVKKGWETHAHTHIHMKEKEGTIHGAIRDQWEK